MKLKKDILMAVIKKGKPSSSVGEHPVKEFNNDGENKAKEKELSGAMDSPYWDKYQDLCGELQQCSSPEEYAKIFYKINKLMKLMDSIHGDDEMEEEIDNEMEY